MQERHGDRPVDVDPHHRGRLRVLGDRAHRLSLPRVADEPAERDQRGHDDRERDHELPRDDDLPDGERRALGDQVGAALVVDAVERERDVGDDERHADRGDQRRQPRRMAQRPVGDALDRRVDDGEERDGDGERDDDPADDDEVARIPGQLEHREEHRARDQAGEREHVAVREVDQLENPVDERVAEGDDAVDRAAREAVEGDVDELLRPLDEVHEQPYAHQAHERQPDPVDDPRVSKSSQNAVERVTHEAATLKRNGREGNSPPARFRTAFDRLTCRPPPRPSPGSARRPSSW